MVYPVPAIRPAFESSTKTTFDSYVDDDCSVYVTAPPFQESSHVSSTFDPSRSLVILATGIEVPEGLTLSHKRHMLDLSGYSLTWTSDIDSQFWDAVSSDWEIVDLVYSHDGIQNSGIVNSRGENKDEFGDYPNWIYRLKNKLRPDLPPIPVGPDDVRTLFPKRQDVIEELKEEKKETHTGYKKKLESILKLRGLIDNTDITAKLTSLKPVQGKGISDRDFEFIDEACHIQELAWENLCGEHTLGDFITVIDSLGEIVRFLRAKNKHLSILPEDRM